MIWMVGAGTRKKLEELAHHRTQEARLVEMARTILGCLEGQSMTAIATGVTTLKRHVEFLDKVMMELPEKREVHAMLANNGTHNRHDARLALHPNVFFHCTPTSAS